MVLHGYGQVERIRKFMSVDKKRITLNGICPYFTMFPLDFPYTILSKYATENDWVLDPFCGRGTTNYASRILGLPSIGIDNNSVAVALSQAKMANTMPPVIVLEAHTILDEIAIPENVPEGEFWELAYHRHVLEVLCRLREGLLQNCATDARKALRAIIMGALHGPQTKTRPSYLSNQSQRTYAPKPRYAVNYWKARNLSPQNVDVLQVIENRANRFYASETTTAVGSIIQGDSRDTAIYSVTGAKERFKWVITSPPYYGMRTYIPDQWLRRWFLGGPSQVEYTNAGQVEHSSPEFFSAQLKQVWQNVGTCCLPDAQLIIRFGAINDRKVDSLSLLRQSLQGIGWEIVSVESAGSASQGRRQAMHFSSNQKSALEEHDLVAAWKGM